MWKSNPAKDITEGVDAVFRDIHYKTHPIAESANSKHGRLSLKGMSVFVNVRSVINDMGRMDTFVFCIAIQNLLRAIERIDRNRSPKKENVLKSDDPPSQKTSKFEVDRSAPLYIWASGICSRELRLKRLYHFSVTDSMFRYWRKGLPDTEMLQQTDSNGRKEVLNGHAGFKNVGNNILCLSFIEAVNEDEHSASCRKPMISPDKKSIALMKNFVPKF